MSDEHIPEEEMLQSVLDYRVAEIHTALPGRIVSYNQSNQTANVQPIGMDDAPELISVPVICIRGGSGYLAFPISNGDTGLIICCEKDIRQWRRGGQEGASGDVAQHSLSSAVFLPGLSKAADVVAQVTGATILAGSDVRLGAATAAQGAVRGTGFMSHLDVFLTALGVFVDAVGGIPGMGTPAATMKAAITVLQNQLSNDLSTKVKVD